MVVRGLLRIYRATGRFLTTYLPFQWLVVRTGSPHYFFPYLILVIALQITKIHQVYSAGCKDMHIIIFTAFNISIVHWMIVVWADRNMPQNSQENISGFAILYAVSLFVMVLDILSVVDRARWLHPHPIFVPDYVKAKSVLTDSLWMLSYKFLCLIFTPILNYMTLWNAKNGADWRSCLVGVWAFMFNRYLSIFLSGFAEMNHGDQKFNLLLVQALVIILLGLCVHRFLYKEILFHPDPPNRFLSRRFLMYHTVTAFQLLTPILLLFRNMCYITKDPIGRVVVRQIDQGMNLNEKNLIWSYPEVQTSINVAIGFPVCCLMTSSRLLNKAKRSYMWDLAIIQAVITGMNVFGPFLHWLSIDIKTAYQLNEEVIQPTLYNPIYLLFNWVPCIASLLQLANLYILKKN